MDATIVADLSEQDNVSSLKRAKKASEGFSPLVTGFNKGLV